MRGPAPSIDRSTVKCRNIETIIVGTFHSFPVSVTSNGLGASRLALTIYASIYLYLTVNRSIQSIQWQCAVSEPMEVDR